MAPSEELIVVIGAGISGLSCAHHLIKNGIKNIKILDAKDRIGGRVHTVRPDEKFFFEEGAQWIHGSDGNSIKKMADENEIYSILENEKKEVYFEAEGKLDSNSDRYKRLVKAEETFNNILKNAEEGKGVEDCGQDLLSYLKAAWKDKYIEVYNQSTTKLFNVLLNLQNIIEGCDSLDTVDLASYSQFAYCMGGDLSVTGGLDQMLYKLKENIPDDKILLKRMVCNVNWSCNQYHNKVVVKAFNIETRKDEFYLADYVVCTTPLGFLKANHDTFFTPHLPPHKIEAIEKLGFGSVTKVIMRFEENLWKKCPVTLHLLRNEPGKFGNYSAMVTRCHINHEVFMTLWLSGEDAINVERINEEKLKVELVEDLRKFIPKLPTPSYMHVSRWKSDPYTRGAYTYIHVGSNPQHLNYMSQPLFVNNSHNGASKEKVLFAGEATHPNFYSTIHGAFDSGKREALRITCFIKQSSNKNSHNLPSSHNTSAKSSASSIRKKLINQKIIN